MEGVVHRPHVLDPPQFELADAPAQVDAVEAVAAAVEQEHGHGDPPPHRRAFGVVAGDLGKAPGKPQHRAAGRRLEPQEIAVGKRWRGYAAVVAKGQEIDRPPVFEADQEIRSPCRRKKVLVERHRLLEVVTVGGDEMKGPALGEGEAQIARVGRVDDAESHPAPARPVHRFEPSVDEQMVPLLALVPVAGAMGREAGVPELDVAHEQQKLLEGAQLRQIVERPPHHDRPRQPVPHLQREQAVAMRMIPVEARLSRRDVDLVGEALARRYLEVDVVRLSHRAYEHAVEMEIGGKRHAVFEVKAKALSFAGFQRRARKAAAVEPERHAPAEQLDARGRGGERICPHPRLAAALRHARRGEDTRAQSRKRRPTREAHRTLSPAEPYSTRRIRPSIPGAMRPPAASICSMTAVAIRRAAEGSSSTLPRANMA